MKSNDRKPYLPLTRRNLLSLASLASISLLSSCGISDDESSSPTATTAPTPTPPATALPTQAPIASPAAGYSDPERWKGRTITIASWGGDFQKTLEAAVFEPFALATGASIDLEVAEISALRRQVDDQQVIWDVMNLPMEDTYLLGAEGYLRDIDYDVVDVTPLFSEIVTRYAVGCAYYSTVMVYPSDLAAPADWSEFWQVPVATPEVEPDLLDTRSLRRSPVGTLEFALLADGVSPTALYPLDVDRAFAKLDAIRNNVLVWWQESKEPIELLAAGQTGAASGWNVRLSQLDLNGPLKVQWNQGMLSSDGWVVPSGAPNADIAMDLVNFATRAIPTANIARLTPFGPVNRDAFALVDDLRLSLLPTAPENRYKQFTVDWEYWSVNREALTLRFEDWLLEPDEVPATPDS